MIPAGTKLGTYALDEPLGAGGMGEVYRARDLRLDRYVALKVLPKELAFDPSRRARFEQEARHVAALNHPNIVALYDIGEQDGIAYMVTELIDGTSLRGVRLPLREVLDVASLADGLDRRALSRETTGTTLPIRPGFGVRAASSRGIDHCDVGREAQRKRRVSSCYMEM